MRESYADVMTNNLLPTLNTFSKSILDEHKHEQTIVLHTFNSAEVLKSDCNINQTSGLISQVERNALDSALNHLANKPDDEVTRTTRKQWELFESTPAAKCKYTAKNLEEELEAPDDTTQSIGFLCQNDRVNRSVSMIVGNYDVLQKQQWASRRQWWFI